MQRKRPVKASRSGIDFVAVCRLAKQLPGVEVGTSYGTPALKANAKLMARMWEDDATLVLRCSATVRVHLISTAPDVFHLTDHYRNYPWVLVRLEHVSTEILAPLLEDAWRQVVGKRVSSAFDAARLHAETADIETVSRRAGA